MNKEVNERLTDWLNEQMNERIKVEWGREEGERNTGFIRNGLFKCWDKLANLIKLKAKKLFRTLCKVTCKQWNYYFSFKWKDMLP